MLDKLAAIHQRFIEVSDLIIEPDVISDMKRYVKLNKEYKDLQPLEAAYQEYKTLVSNIEESKDILENETDPEMKEMAKMELDDALPRKNELDEEVKVLLVPKDPEDAKNAQVEIRAGTGGDESSLFAGNLFRMYSRYAERQRWQVEIISQSPSDVGGFKEIIAKIIGQGAYSRLKFESGAHRVQRVPVTETQGRVHTSTCTVAVIPEADEISEVQLNPADLRIDTFRASGAGGQHINKTDSAVRVTHLPTGIVVECQDGRSQHKNKAQALSVLSARIYDKQMSAHQSEQAAERKSLVGSGERSGRIRTYNFPQGRVTDHRINLTLYKMDQIMDGELGEICSALMTEHQADQLAAMMVE